MCVPVSTAPGMVYVCKPTPWWVVSEETRKTRIKKTLLGVSFPSPKHYLYIVGWEHATDHDLHSTSPDTCLSSGGSWMSHMGKSPSFCVFMCFRRTWDRQNHTPLRSTWRNHRLLHILEYLCVCVYESLLLIWTTWELTFQDLSIMLGHTLAKNLKRQVTDPGAAARNSSNSRFRVISCVSIAC